MKIYYNSIEWNDFDMTIYLYCQLADISCVGIPQYGSCLNLREAMVNIVVDCIHVLIDDRYDIAVWYLADQLMQHFIIQHAFNVWVKCETFSPLGTRHVHKNVLV